MKSAKLQSEQIKDFSVRISKIYALLNWMWADRFENMIPDAKEIERNIVNLINEVKNSKEGCKISSGGLFAERIGLEICFGFEDKYYLIENLKKEKEQ